jgi:DNA repair ATPase RecN
MRSLFDELGRTMQGIGSESERIRKLVREVYEGFRNQLGLEISTPKVFAPLKYRVEIELLFQEVRAFQRSLETILSSRGAVIARFDEQIVSRARVLFEQLRVAHEDWLREALEPLANGINSHKAAMEKRLDTLQRVSDSRDQLKQRIQAMQGQYVAFAQVLTALRNIQNALNADPTAETGLEQRPRLVSGG